MYLDLDQDLGLNWVNGFVRVSRRRSREDFPRIHNHNLIIKCSSKFIDALSNPFCGTSMTTFLQTKIRQSFRETFHFLFPPVGFLMTLAKNKTKWRRKPSEWTRLRTENPFGLWSTQPETNQPNPKLSQPNGVVETRCSPIGCDPIGARRDWSDGRPMASRPHRRRYLMERFPGTSVQSPVAVLTQRSSETAVEHRTQPVQPVVWFVICFSLDGSLERPRSNPVPQRST